MPLAAVSGQDVRPNKQGEWLWLNRSMPSLKAINRGDLRAAVALYEPNAVLVVRPGHLVRGAAEIREALAGFVVLNATLRSETQRVLQADDVALYVGRWNLRGTDPAGQAVVLNGESSDILRRQRDGRWLIVLDNPWGAEILSAP